MITIYPYEQLGRADHGWLNARHHFSFADYQNPERHGFGVLRVINDDIIKSGAGFDTHPHRDMEIITYVKKGAITHKDSKGNEGQTKAGNVQVMSAGRGIFHSEYNLESDDTNIFQIWIEPKEKGIEPTWSMQNFPQQPIKDSLLLLASGDGKAPLFIHQDAYIYAGTLTPNKTIEHSIIHQAYIVIAEGEIEIDGQKAKEGDGIEVINQSLIRIQSITDAKVIVIDVPAENNIATH